MNIRKIEGALLIGLAFSMLALGAGLLIYSRNGPDSPAGPGRMYEKHHTTQFKDCVLRVGSIAAERGLADEQAFLLLGECASDRGLML